MRVWLRQREEKKKSTKKREEKEEGGREILLHQGNAVGALDVLCWVLAASNVQRRDQVGRMGIVASNGASHGGSHQVLAIVHLHQRVHRGLEDRLHDLEKRRTEEGEIGKQGLV